MEEWEAATSNKDAVGLYLYCIAEGNEKTNFGNIGVDKTEVYTIPCEDLLAVVHNCQARPYESKDNELVKKWIIAHQEVVDTAWDRFGNILPFGFDTIIRPEDGRASEENMKLWIKKDLDNLKEKLNKVRGKAEYGIQISWDPKTIAEEIIQTVPHIKNLDEEIRAKSAGAAFMYEEKLKKLIREEMEKRADECFKDFYARIRAGVDDIKVDRIKKAGDGKQMLANLSCLLVKDKEQQLGGVLDGIDAIEGIFVRFTGPWPPYSFASAG